MRRRSLMSRDRYHPSRWTLTAIIASRLANGSRLRSSETMIEYPNDRKGRCFCTRCTVASLQKPRYRGAFSVDEIGIKGLPRSHGLRYIRTSPVVRQTATPVFVRHVEAHEGRLWATANVPHGATFQFTLPLNADTAS
jgi:hypothetical protein